MRSCGSRKLRLSAFQRECPDSLLYLRLIFIRRTLTAAALCHIAGDRTREQSSSCVPCEFRSSVSPVRSQRSCILLRSKALGPGPGWHRPSSLLCRTVPPFPAPPTAAKIVRAPCAPRAALLSILYHCPAALRIPLQWYAPGTYLVPLPPTVLEPVRYPRTRFLFLYMGRWSQCGRLLGDAPPP
jgi:hypothetical protein